MFAGHPVTSVARMFFTRVGAEGWACLPLAAQCALPLKDRRVVGWLIVTGRLRPSAGYLVACRPYLGEVAARHHRAFYERFAAASAGLGFGPVVTRLQWSALAKVTAVAGLGPGQVTQAVIDEGRQALTAAIGRHRPGSHGPGALSAALFGLQTTLFHLGVLGTAPRKTSPDRLFRDAQRERGRVIGGERERDSGNPARRCRAGFGCSWCRRDAHSVDMTSLMAARAADWSAIFLPVA